MMEIMYIPILVLYSFGKVSAASFDDLGTIVFANILYRHGDRTPVDPYPKDPYRNESCWPVPFGQLTTLGKHQHLMLGKWFRNRYNHLLPEKYSPHDIYVQSTDVDRTLMSAEANLAGLYTPVGDQVWDIKEWMPIPVHTTPEKEDAVLASKKYCPRYNFEYNKVMKSPEMRSINKKYEKVYNYLSYHTGRKVANLETAESIYYVLYIEDLYNKTLPEWTKSVYPDKLKPIAEESFKLEAYNKILQRLKSGTLLGEMVKHMVQKSKNALTPDRKIWMYSAHDETIANMLMTLDLFEPHCPPYTATILIELRQNADKQYFVTVSYKNSSAEPTVLTLPNCLPLCPLSQFIRLTKDSIPEDRDKECLLEWDNLGYQINETAIIAILTSSILMLVFLIFFITGFIYWHYKREHPLYLRLPTEPRDLNYPSNYN